MTARSAASRARGGPLVMLALLLVGWSTARAMWWQNPFPPLAGSLSLPQRAAHSPAGVRASSFSAALAVSAMAAPGWTARSPRRVGADPRPGAGHQLLSYAAQRDRQVRGPATDEAETDLPARQSQWTPAAPFLPAPALVSLSASVPPAGRWSLDTWAFWRQGSNAAPVSQGRVPIYGASQTGAVLQYRLAPGSARDPRLYARAYRALVGQGENELAFGASVRPFARVPLRMAGEVRYTDGAFGDTFRPAAYVVSQLAPAPLPYGARLEAYAQAGWVGGPDPTAFADGQASVTGEVRQIAGLTDNALRISLGAAAWGGAQKDAQRIDIGPTLRLDLSLGRVPARLSVDWRERVGGDAGPDSGLAATLSTQF